MKLTIQECRQLLGKEAQKMSDKEIEKLRDDLSELAELLIDSFLEEKRQSTS